MFETLHINARTGADGHLRVDVPLDLPPDSQVKVIVSSSPVKRFADRQEWEAHARRIVGSIPDIERPEQWPMREIEPL